MAALFPGLSPQEEECSPHLLTVDLQRPRANSDPGATFCVPEITVEDFSGGEGATGGEGNSAPGSPYRPRANTCPEDLFRARKGRPPTPPPMCNPRGIHVVQRTPSKERVSFVHHRLSKVTEDGGGGGDSAAGDRGRLPPRPGTSSSSRLSAFRPVASSRRHSQPGPRDLRKLSQLRSDLQPLRGGFEPSPCRRGQPSDLLARQTVVGCAEPRLDDVPDFSSGCEQQQQQQQRQRRTPWEEEEEEAGQRRLGAIGEGPARPSSLRSAPLAEESPLLPVLDPEAEEEAGEGAAAMMANSSSPMGSPGSFRARDCRFNPCRLVGDGTHLQAC